MEKELLAELAGNCEGKREKLVELLKGFELANIGWDIQEQHAKDIHNRVLAENVFLCAKDLCDIKIGERITDEENLFLLSDADFDKVMKFARPICVEEHLTDKDGYFLEDWGEIRRKAREHLVSFIIWEIIPESMRHHFTSCLWNIVQSDKLIKIFKDSIKNAA